MMPYLEIDDDEDNFSMELDYTLKSYKPSKVVYELVKGKYVLQQDLSIEFSMSTHDAPMIVDKYRLNIKKGFKIDGVPMPKFWSALFPNLGENNIYDSAAFFLAAMYESAGFNEFGREDCDKFYLTVINGVTRNPITRILRKVAATIFIGSNLTWDDGNDEITYTSLDFFDSDD